jgi:hypothetical protein
VPTEITKVVLKPAKNTLYFWNLLHVKEFLDKSQSQSTESIVQFIVHHHFFTPPLFHNRSSSQHLLTSMPQALIDVCTIFVTIYVQFHMQTLHDEPDDDLVSALRDVLQAIGITKHLSFAWLLSIWLSSKIFSMDMYLHGAATMLLRSTHRLGRSVMNASASTEHTQEVLRYCDIYDQEFYAVFCHVSQMCVRSLATNSEVRLLISKRAVFDSDHLEQMSLKQIAQLYFTAFDNLAETRQWFSNLPNGLQFEVPYIFMLSAAADMLKFFITMSTNVEVDLVIDLKMMLWVANLCYIDVEIPGFTDDDRLHFEPPLREFMIMFNETCKALSRGIPFEELCSRHIERCLLDFLRVFLEYVFWDTVYWGTAARSAITRIIEDWITHMPDWELQIRRREILEFIEQNTDVQSHATDRVFIAADTGAFFAELGITDADANIADSDVETLSIPSSVTDAESDD